VSLVSSEDGERELVEWTSQTWRAQAIAWLDERLFDAGIKRTGEVDQPHIVPWATVLSAPTTAGKVWLKATAPGTAFELGLYRLLTKVAPEHVLEPIAIDEQRGWILLPDGGPSLGDRIRGTDLVAAMVVALPQYAEIQLALSEHADDLLKLGLFDLRPSTLPPRYDDALENWRGDVAYEPLASLRATFVGWCDLLAESPVTASLDHNDLHPWNILGIRPGDPAGEQSAMFYDWGDSVVAHPFASALIPLSNVRRHLRHAPDHPDVHRMRDAYLEVYEDLAPRTALVEMLELACQVAKTARAVVWDRSPKAVREYAYLVSVGDLGI